MVRSDAWFRACLALLTTSACSVDPEENGSSFSAAEASSFTSASDNTTSVSDGESESASASDGTTRSETEAGASSADSGDGDASGDGDTETSESTAGDGDADSNSGDGDGDSGGSGGPLDPDLDVPPASAEPCNTPGSLSECPSTQVCRFFDTLEGRCESCDTCGNLNAFCNEGTDCDILFACYQNSCTNFCTLGTTECGAPSDCIDIGHPSKGVCLP